MNGTARPATRAHAEIAGRFIRAYWITMRPYLLFVSGIVGIAGMAFAPSLPACKTGLLAAGFSLTYGFGQALTDVFQTDTDLISSPYRPLVRGVIRRRDVLAVSAAGLGATGLLFAACNPATIPFGLIAIAGLATYTPFKRRWWGGPLYNAWIVAVLFVVGFLCGGGNVHAILGLRTAAIGTVFFGYSSFVLVGYCKDVSADRATGYRTIPVVWGFRTSAVIADVLAALTLASCAIVLAARPDPAAVGFGLAGATATIAGTVRLHSLRDERHAHRAIVPNLHGYVLLVSAICAAARPRWAIPLALLYAGFVFTMNRRPTREQI